MPHLRREAVDAELGTIGSGLIQFLPAVRSRPTAATRGWHSAGRALYREAAERRRYFQPVLKAAGDTSGHGDVDVRSVVDLLQRNADVSDAGDGHGPHRKRFRREVDLHALRERIQQRGATETQHA
jgi:hypothetical protein